MLPTSGQRTQLTNRAHVSPSCPLEGSSAMAAMYTAPRYMARPTRSRPYASARRTRAGSHGHSCSHAAQSHCGRRGVLTVEPPVERRGGLSASVLLSGHSRPDGGRARQHHR
ncbi:hypothetical protein NKG94_39895 [Micromonospora sp. M12]